MNEFRRKLVEHGDLESEMPPDAAFLIGHQTSAAFLLAGFSRTYPELLQRFAAEGPTADLEAEALDLAGTLATLLQSMRSREDLLQAAEHGNAPDVMAPVPMTVLDQLFHSLVLLTAGSTEDERTAALTADEFDVLMNTRRVRASMDWTGAEEMLEPPEDAIGEGSPEG
jgi:hypothetical protein